MRVCVDCGKFGARVDYCARIGTCRIANQGTEVIASSDHLDERATGGFIVMPPTDPSTTLAGDAVLGETFDLTQQRDPTYKTEVFDLKPPPRIVSDPFNRIVREQTSLYTDAEVTSIRAESDRLVEDMTRLFGGPGNNLAKAAKAGVVTSPDGNPKTAIGITKPSLHSIPPVALLHLGQAMADGNRKYGLVNWRHDPITMSVYWNAMQRHLLALWDGQDVDPATGIHHLAYVMANCAILLDAQEQSTLTDDRSPIKGGAAHLIERMTRKPEKET